MPKPPRRIEGFQRVHWLRWGQVLCAERAGMPRGGLVAITRPSSEGVLTAHLIHTERGFLASEQGAPFSSLSDLAERYHVAWVFALNEGAAVSLGSSYSSNRDGDYLERVLELWDTLTAMQAGGALETFPHRLEEWPFLVDVLPAGLDRIVDEGESAVAAIWRGGELYTALALRKRGGRVDSLVGPDSLVPAMGLVSGDFRRDYRFLSQAVSRDSGPLGFGFFGHHAAVRELFRRASSRAWAEAVATRDVIVAPMNPSLALPLGLDLGRSALRSAGNFLSSMGFGTFVPSELKTFLEPTAQRPDVRDFMEFDPLAILELATSAVVPASGEKTASPEASAGE